MFTIKVRLIHQSDPPLQEPVPEPPLVGSFICTRITSRPIMTREACDERKKQCGEKAAQGCRNTLTECLGCPGHSTMRVFEKTDEGRKNRGKWIYHFRERRHKDHPCNACGRSLWLVGDYCVYCQQQISLGIENGRTENQVVRNIKAYFKAGGVFVAGMRSMALWSWKPGDHILVPTKKGHRDTCEWCGRPGLVLQQRFAQRFACGFCGIRLKKLRDAGGTDADLLAIKPQLIEEALALKGGPCKGANGKFIRADVSRYAGGTGMSASP